MVRPLDESQWSSPLQGHGSWLVCEVAQNQQGGMVLMWWHGHFQN